MNSPYRQFEVPVNLNLLCTEYLSRRNLANQSPPAWKAKELQATTTLLKTTINIALGFGFQDRVGGNVHTLTDQLDEVEFPLNTRFTKEWYEDAADKAIDLYFERATKSVQSLNDSLAELTKAVKDRAR